MNTEEKQTELQVVEVLTPELLTIAETSGLVLTEAQAIGSKFAPYMSVVNDLSAQINDLKGQEITPELAKYARKLRLELVSNRGSKGLLATKEELKAGLLTRTRLIDKYVGVVEESSKLSEQAAESIEKHAERIEEARLEKVKSDRVALLLPYGEVNQYIDLKAMDETAFNNLLSDTKLAYETRRENERLAELKRLEDEKKAEQERIEAEKKAEAERVEKEKLIKHRTKLMTDAGISFNGEYFEAGDCVLIEYSELCNKDEELFNKILNKGIEFVAEEKAEQDRIKAENEKLRLENEAKEKQLVKEREAQQLKNKRAKELAPFINYIRDYDKLINSSEADFQKELDEMSKAFLLQQKYDSEKLELDRKIQQEKDAEIAKLKADQEAERFRKEKELSEEKSRIEAETAEKLAKEKAALLAPDKEKINALYVQIRDFQFPEVKTDEANKIISDVKESFAFLLTAIKEQAKSLK